MEFLGTIGHFILTPLYYAVSAVLLAWHWLFSLFLDPDGGAAWVLSIIGLTLVVRAALIPLFVKQIKSSRNMQLIQPKVKELQKKYGHDRERLAQETMNALQGDAAPTRSRRACRCWCSRRSSSRCSGCSTRRRRTAPRNGFMTTEQADEPRRTRSCSGRSRSRRRSSTTDGLRQRADRGRAPGGGDDRHDVHHPAPADEQEHAGRRDERSRTPSSRRCCSTCSRWSFAVGGIAFPIGVLVYWTTTNLWTMGQQFYVIRRNPAPGTPAFDAKAGPRPGQGHGTVDRGGGARCSRRPTQPRPASAPAAQEAVPRAATRRRPTEGGPSPTPGRPMTSKRGTRHERHRGDHRYRRHRAEVADVQPAAPSR